MTDTGSTYSYYDEESDYYDAEYGEHQVPLVGGRGNGRPINLDEEGDEEGDEEEEEDEEEEFKPEDKKADRGRSEEKYKRSQPSTGPPKFVPRVPTSIPSARPPSSTSSASSSSSSSSSTVASPSASSPSPDASTSRARIPKRPNGRDGDRRRMRQEMHELKDEEEELDEEEEIEEEEVKQDQEKPRREDRKPEKSKKKTKRLRICGLKTAARTICWLYLWGFLFCWMIEGLCILFSRYSPTGLVAASCGIFYLGVVTFVLLYYLLCKPLFCPAKRRSSRRSRDSSDSRHRKRSRDGSRNNLLPAEPEKERKKHRSGSGRRPPPVIPAMLGALLIGTVAGVMGGYAFQHLWAEDTEGVYEDVDPYDNATSYPQAVQFHFISNAYVKSSIGGSFAATDGHHYCAAPLLVKLAHENQPLSFIAASTDCCRGSPPSSSNNNISTFEATCKDWSSSDFYGYVITDPVTISSYSHAITSGSQGNNFQVDTNAYFVTIESASRIEKSNISNITVGWLIIALSPIVWPIGWFLVQGLTAVFTCAKSLSKATSPSL